MATSVSNEVFIVGPDQDLIRIYTLLMEKYRQEDVLFLHDGQLRLRCETRNGPAMRYTEELSRQFPRTTIGWWCWAEYGAYHCCQIFAAGATEWDHYGSSECYEDEDESDDSSGFNAVDLYQQTIDMFLSAAALRINNIQHNIIGRDIAEEPEEPLLYDLL